MSPFWFCKLVAYSVDTVHLRHKQLQAFRVPFPPVRIFRTNQFQAIFYRQLYHTLPKFSKYLNAIDSKSLLNYKSCLFGGLRGSNYRNQHQNSAYRKDSGRLSEFYCPEYPSSCTTASISLRSIGIGNHSPFGAYFKRSGVETKQKSSSSWPLRSLP